MTAAIPPDSDLARLLAFLDGAGYTRSTSDQEQIVDSRYIITAEPSSVAEHYRRTKYGYYYSVKLEEGIGYGEFYCIFYFTSSGAFVAHGVYE